MHRCLSDLEGYSQSGFAIHGVFKGESSEGVLLCLLPGQEAPKHPHERFELVIVPQKGEALLTVNGDKQVVLRPACVYHEPAGQTYAVKNNGAEPFVALIVLSRAERPA